MIKHRLLIATLASTLLSTPAWAGDRNEPQAHRLDYIFNELQLTDEQRTQTLDIMKSTMEQRRQDIQARRQSGDARPDRETMKARRETHRTELAERLNTVMTDEQVEDLLTYLDAHRPRPHRWHKRGQAHGDERPLGERKSDQP